MVQTVLLMWSLWEIGVLESSADIGRIRPDENGKFVIIMSILEVGEYGYLL